jgi:hypothetical protein
MILVEREQPSHWYLRSGAPFHTVARADGNGDRPVTVRDARKVGALPSVTNKLSVMAKPGLNAWHVEQGILASLTLPRLPGESEDAFARRVAADASEQSKAAMGTGSAVHAAIEAYAKSLTPPPDDLMPMLLPFIEWWRANVRGVEALEVVCVNAADGYAGRADCVAVVGGKVTLLDFKTQTAKDGKPSWYETWPLQLEAYARAYRGFRDIEAIASVVIPTTPGKAGCHVRVWPQDERDGYWRAFQAACELWRYVKGYDPRRQQDGKDGAA